MWCLTSKKLPELRKRVLLKRGVEDRLFFCERMVLLEGGVLIDVWKIDGFEDLVICGSDDKWILENDLNEILGIKHG
jgi:hypothetical protein